MNVEDTVDLFFRVTSNTIRVFLLASLIGVYMLIFVWAWRKDQADMQKVLRLIPKALPQCLKYVEQDAKTN